MQKKTYVILLVSGLVLLSGLLIFKSRWLGSEEEKLKTQKEKVSYSIGWDIGSNFKRQTIEVEPEIFLRGFKDGVAGKSDELSEQERGEVLKTYQQELSARQNEARGKQAEKNKKEGEEFLTKNKKNKGVVTLPSGLQYRVIKEGTGEKPKPTETVTVNYKGTLIDGTEFDSSYRRGQPATFPVNGVIKGWTEVLPLMKVGSQWELFIPAELAYGERGAGAQIGPNATLIFNVELLSVAKK